MAEAFSPEQLRSFLVHRTSMIASGWTDRKIQRAVTERALYRVSPGWYLDAQQWDRLRFEQQHLIRAWCTRAAAATPPLFSHYTAAAIVNLPLLRFADDRVHTLVPASNSRRSRGSVVRHRAVIEPDDVADSAGLLHTNEVRTLLDLIRVASFEQGVVAGDVLLRRFVSSRQGSVEGYRAMLLARLESMSGSRGKDRARRVIEFLDPLSESPLESLFRLQLARLGFEIRLQVRVRAQDGSWYRMDMELVGYGVFLEADGRVKYTEQSMLGGKSLQEVLLNERKRENWVSGTTNARTIRGVWKEALTPQQTATMLRNYGVTPPSDISGRMRRDLF